jgi:hypothetical protein
MILRISEIFEAETTTRWGLNLRSHLELRLLKDLILFADKMIRIKDGSIFGKDDVI